MKTLRVLLVEDDAMIGMLIADILTDMGHDVCAIEATKRDAVTAAAHHRPDLLIVDGRLSDGTGVSAVEEICRNEYVPHLFISGNISTVKTLRPDAVVLAKPFGESDLMRAIECVHGIGAKSSSARTKAMGPAKAGAPTKAAARRTTLSEGAAT
jgi:two-component system, response regulator PdtaR